MKMKPDQLGHPDFSYRNENGDSLHNQHESQGRETYSLIDEGFRPIQIPESSNTHLFLPHIKDKSFRKRKRARLYKSQLSISLPRISPIHKPQNGQSTIAAEQERSKSYDKLSYSMRLSSATGPAPSCTSYTLPPKYGYAHYIKRQEKTWSHPTININTNNRTVAYHVGRSGLILDNVSETPPPIGSPLYNHKEQLKRGGRVPLVTKGSLLQPLEGSNRNESFDADLNLLINPPVLGKTSGPLIGRPGQRNMIHVGLVRKTEPTSSTTDLSDLRLP